MGFRIKVEGKDTDTIELNVQNVKTVKLKTDLPIDSNARTKDVGSTMTITGKILAATGGDAFDATRQLGLWSLVPAESSQCYRAVTVEVISNDQVVRKIYYPYAFVVDYVEHFSDDVGIGEFKLVIKQKKDKLSLVTVEGGFAVEG